MAGGLIGLLVIAAAVAIFATTRRGRWIQQAMWSRSGALPGPKASDEDHAFLLRACDDEYDRVRERLGDELRRNPNLSEADAYRKAIRRYMKEREGGLN